MRPILAAAGAVCLLALPAFAAPVLPGLEVTAHIPADPLFVWAVETESAAAELDAMLALIAEVTPEEQGFEPATALAEIDEKLGVSLHDDLLARLGPELAFVVDLPPLDTVVGLMASPTAEGIDRALGGIGFVGAVREPRAFAVALRTALTNLGAVVSERDGAFVATFPETGPSAGEPELAVHWRVADGWVAIGVGPSWPAAAAAARPSGTSLAAGADFGRIAAHLDPRPRSLVYLNLPKIAALLRDSGFVQSMAGANPEGRAVLDAWLGGDRLALGWGSTAVEVDGAVRTTGYGPELVKGGMFGGVLAAIAIPNLVNAIERGRTKRTMADVRTLAVALESYAVDENVYPTTEGWVPTDALSGTLSPMYLRAVPASDGWGRPLTVVSTGDHYVIVSPGRNGQVDGDWGLPLPDDVDAGATDDIVFADGEFVSYPEGLGP